MALVAKPFGFSPVRTLDANEFTEQGTMYFIPSSDGSAYYIGDAVKSVANGDANGIPAMQKSTGVTTELQRGVYLGNIQPPPNQVSIQGLPLALEYTAIPATKTIGYYILVVDDSDVLFAMQDDGATPGNCVAANCNKNSTFNIVVGSSLVSYSGNTLASTGFAVTVGFPVRLIGLTQGIYEGQINAFGGFGVWLCKLNQHELQGNTVGV